MPDRLLKEFNEMKDMLIKAITKKFSRPFMIEYGIWGQSIHHAHIHFIPSKGEGYEIKNIIEDMVKLQKIKVHKTTWKRLKTIYNEEKAYVSIKDGDMYVCHVNKLPKNYNPVNLILRKFFSEVIGLKGVKNWKELTNEEKALDEEKRNKTKEALTKELFNKVSNSI